ncbi:DUF1772-domain-containing protein [Byssothecium circinans]|uniref:DUF1772-domain-containing protein n=1 Tax=Byssothecium circinans TaxID=147558 RepID=A0A6A5TIJ0_9PLEO|nr:DUF1772-domain-containing protein [Byssothecium circinans]
MALITPALQTYSILATSIAAVTNLSTSIVTFPALLHAQPPTLTKQWHILYTSGRVPAVSAAMTGAAGFAVLAYRIATTRNLYLAAAAITLSLVPYTALTMFPTINELSRRAQAGDKDEKGDTRALVEKWGRLNLWRGVLLLTAAGLGTWASVI